MGLFHYRVRFDNCSRNRSLPLPYLIAQTKPVAFAVLEVDDEIELGRLLDRKIGRLRSLENLVHLGRARR